MSNEEFLLFVRKTSTCWYWLGDITSNGYGCLTVNGKTVLAHRESFERFVRPLLPGEIVHHVCQHKLCIRPDKEHIDACTQKNHPDAGGTINRNKTHCPRGHEYTEANTRFMKGRFGRQCRACANLNEKIRVVTNSIRSQQ